MKKLHKLIVLMLVLTLALSLAVPAAATASEDAAAPEAPITTQFITDTVFDYSSLGFSCDQYGIVSKYGNYMPISVYGELLAGWFEGYGRSLTDDLFGLSRNGFFALFHCTGKQLTGYQYTELEVIDGYVRAKKGYLNYDFFTSDGRFLPKPKLPKGYVVERYLDDDLIVAGDATRSNQSFEEKLWQLYTTDGTRLTPKGTFYLKIERLTDDLLVISETSRHRGIVNEQGTFVYPIKADYSIYTLDTGEFITGAMVNTSDPTLHYAVEYICYNAKGERLWSHIGQNAKILLGRYLATETPNSRSVALLDGSGPVELPENIKGIAAEGFEIGNLVTDQLRDGQIVTPMFYATTTDGICTFYDIDGNVVIPATYCYDVSFGCGHAMIVNEEHNTDLYNIKGEKVATLPGSGYAGISSGLIWHKKGNTYAIYNLKGEQVTDYIYSSCTHSGVAIGLANVCRNGKWFLINAAGEEQNKTGFDMDVTFNCHFAGYQIGKNWGIIRYLEPGANIFWDVKPGDWYSDAVDYCYDNEIMTGTGVGRFQPDGVTTRAMVVTVLYRIAHSPEVEGKLPFADTAANQWYSDAVLWASQNGIVTGYPDGGFHPNDNITREQLATILYRYSQFAGMELAEGADLSAFPDHGNVGDYAQDAIGWAVAEGLINGTVSGGVTSLSPKASATRAQFATIISRYQQMFQDAAE